MRGRPLSLGRLADSFGKLYRTRRVLDPVAPARDDLLYLLEATTIPAVSAIPFAVTGGQAGEGNAE